MSKEEKIIRNLEKLTNDKNAENQAKTLLVSIMNQKEINKSKISEKK